MVRLRSFLNALKHRGWQYFWRWQYFWQRLRQVLKSSRKCLVFSTSYFSSISESVLWPPTRASFPGRGQATQKNTFDCNITVTSEVYKGNRNQPYLIQLGEGLPTNVFFFAPSVSRFCCPVFFLSSTVSDTVGSHYPDPANQEHVLYVFSYPSSPPDTNSPNAHAKNPDILKNVVFTSFSPCF